MKLLLRASRFIILVSIFIFLAFYTKIQKTQSRSWSEPLQVMIYPINAENSPIVENYIDQLETANFSEIDQFFQQQAENFSLIIKQPTLTTLGETISKHPPISPTSKASFLEKAWWGLKVRYWAFKTTPDNLSNFHRIRIFIHYHEMAYDKPLQHSYGMDKGLLAIVHAFADEQQEQQNNIIIAHELLHTVGATDKHNDNHEPAYPEGYAEPNKQPLFPQDMAEIMAATIPLSLTSSIMADSLDQCIISEKTALEINWLKAE